MQPAWSASDHTLNGLQVVWFGNMSQRQVDIQRIAPIASTVPLSQKLGFAVLVRVSELQFAGQVCPELCTLRGHVRACIFSVSGNVLAP